MLEIQPAAVVHVARCPRGADSEPGPARLDPAGGDAIDVA
jgi:hypothetical protein